MRTLLKVSINGLYLLAVNKLIIKRQGYEYTVFRRKLKIKHDFEMHVHQLSCALVFKKIKNSKNFLTFQ